MGLVTSNLAQMDRAILFQSIGRWFKSIISLFILTSAFPSLSIHFDIFFLSSGSNITAFFCITL